MGSEPAFCADRLKLVGDPARLRMLELLQTRPMTVSEIAEALQLPLMLASHHLKILRTGGFLDRTKQGRFAIYSLAEGVLASGQLNLGCCQLSFPPQVHSLSASRQEKDPPPARSE